jgi:serpin B
MQKILGLAVVLFVVAAAGCGGDDDNANTGGAGSAGISGGGGAGSGEAGGSAAQGGAGGSAGTVAGAGGGGAGSGAGAGGGGGATAGTGPSQGGAGAGTGGAGPTTSEQRSALARDATPDVSRSDYQTFISNTNDFGLDVFGELVGNDDGNVFFSPVSTAVALGMTYAGARGNTAAQMAAAMHNDLPDEAFHAAFNQLALDLDSRNIAPHDTYDGTKSVRVSLVNASWAQEDYSLLAPFLDILGTQYGAGVKLLDFIGDPDGSRIAINQWVASQTEDRIQDLIPPSGIDTDTRLVLTNALYFYATWQTPFLIEATSDGTFHTLAAGEVTVPMMHDTSYLAYAEGDGYQMIDLPYDGGELAMSIVLPAAGRFGEIRDSLSSDWLDQARASMSTDSEIQLSLPRFKYTWGTESLKPALQALGMIDAFVYPTADFTGMEPRRELYISDVFHQAFVAVDEHGTEAAAATAVVMTAGAIPATPIPFTVDRPFIFFIRDTTGLILFVGQVVDPTA